MKSTKREDLARAWIHLQNAPRESKSHRENFWAHEAIWELLHNNPDEAWSTILEILKQDKSDWIIENLAAGPLEDLLVAHGRQFIGHIEAVADDPIFQKLARLVWKNDIPDDVWLRLQAIRNSNAE
ncbi:hypothetical protein FRZ61_27710 [Hypericibacter adhaerens]|jgi:hypothetical protein|uniref:DUF6869 domain-containing protein n=1 Tax=Hypericibacter adhaerens TaxID=2602016 RepID=A0A5J6MYN1_9PROT|nr:hypothetical protein [Hypericibacter adhaerens]QEX22838.1 hypothetical protein FRZ61_27710 [Hypericibacter adhaerens]